MFFVRKDSHIRSFPFIFITRILHSLILLIAELVILYNVPLLAKQYIETDTLLLSMFNSTQNIIFIYISIFVISMAFCLILSWFLYILCEFMPKLTRNDIIVHLDDTNDITNVKCVIRTVDAELYNYIIVYMYIYSSIMFYFMIGITHGSGIFIVFKDFWSGNQLMSFRFLTLIIESLQIPLTLVLNFLPMFKSFQYIFCGLFLSLTLLLFSQVASTLTYDFDFTINSIVNVQNVNIHKERFSIMEGITKNQVKLYCQQDNRVCQQQKNILGILSKYDYEGESKTLNEFKDIFDKFKQSTNIDTNANTSISVTNIYKYFLRLYRLAIYIHYAKRMNSAFNPREMFKKQMEKQLINARDNNKNIIIHNKDMYMYEDSDNNKDIYTPNKNTKSPKENHLDPYLLKTKLNKIKMNYNNQYKDSENKHIQNDKLDDDEDSDQDDDTHHDDYDYEIDDQDDNQNSNPQKTKIPSCNIEFYIEDEHKIHYHILESTILLNTTPDIFTYTQKYSYNAQISTISPIVQCYDSLHINRQFLIECQVSSGISNFSILCKSNEGKEIDFLITITSYSSPVWVFPKANKIYSGILTLNELKQIL